MVHQCCRILSATLWDLDDLQVLQNKIARLVSGFDCRTSRNLIFDRVGWMTIRQLVQFHTSITVCRIRKSAEPEYLATCLLNENRNGNIIIKLSRLTLYRKSFLYRGICNWNSLSCDLKNIEDSKLFKRELRQWIFKRVSRF